MSFPPNYQGGSVVHRSGHAVRDSTKPPRSAWQSWQEPVPAFAREGEQPRRGHRLSRTCWRELRQAVIRRATRIRNGFRNKIVEALASGTFVIGTPMHWNSWMTDYDAYCLSRRRRKTLQDKIEGFLNNPRALMTDCVMAMGIVRETYQWANGVNELDKLCHQVLLRALEKMALSTRCTVRGVVSPFGKEEPMSRQIQIEMRKHFRAMAASPISATRSHLASGGTGRISLSAT